MNNSRLNQLIGLTLMVVMFLTACGTPQPVPTPIPPTSIPPTPIPPTATATQTPAEMSPSPRAYISMAYDTESDRIILFGGLTGNYQLPSSSNGETWAYDVTANKWTQMKPLSGPTERGAVELAYDIESDQVILYGGAGGPNTSTWGLADTWAYDFNTNTWTAMANGPANHLGARLAYDAESDKVVLFGGYNMSGFLYNDTWVYDFNSDAWTEMKPTSSPPGRNYQAMTYDVKADRVLTWGGTDANGKPLDANIWSYDFNTNTWQEIKPGEGANPVARDYSAMVYDAKSDRTILYGGVLLGGGETGNETWAYDYNTNIWANLKPSTVPEQLSRHTIVYSTAANRVILFGGQAANTTLSGETWSYDFNTNTWTNVTPKP